MLRYDSLPKMKTKSEGRNSNSGIEMFPPFSNGERRYCSARESGLTGFLIIAEFWVPWSDFLTARSSLYLIQVPTKKITLATLKYKSRFHLWWRNIFDFFYKKRKLFRLQIPWNSLTCPSLIWTYIVSCIQMLHNFSEIVYCPSHTFQEFILF